MAVTAYPRRDTEENWIKYNPILKKDEICVVYTNYAGTMYKKGNGNSRYTELPFLPLEEVLEYGVMYSNGITVKVRGFFNKNAGEQNEEQVYCPGEFVW